MQVEILRGVRKRLELPADDRGPEEVEVAAGVHGLSSIELTALLDLAVQRYQSKRMDPGKPCFATDPSAAVIVAAAHGIQYCHIKCMAAGKAPLCPSLGCFFH